MKIIRARAGAAVDLMHPYLQEDTDVSRERYAEGLRSMLDNAPDQTFILQAFEDDNLVAFLIAYASDGKSYITVIQAWASEGLKDQKALDNLFLRLLLWADNFNRKELWFEVLKGTKPFITKWIKRRRSSTRIYSIPEAFDTMNFQEDENGKTKNDKKELPETGEAESERKEG